MPASSWESLRPVTLRKENEDRLAIDWNDGHHSVYTWKHLRDNCTCAGCRDERSRPADPFRILKPNELAPLKPVAMTAVGHYAYKITWSDGHDAGIYTLENLRAMCQCAECEKTNK
jgi:DUF971 family protein